MPWEYQELVNKHRRQVSNTLKMSRGHLGEREVETGNLKWDESWGKARLRKASLPYWIALLMVASLRLGGIWVQATARQQEMLQGN